MVADRPKPHTRRALEEKILELARANNVAVDSLLVIAVLSCIYDTPTTKGQSRARTPGRAVIKPRPNYSDEDAYNALCDLQSLELMLQAHGLQPEAQPVIYTYDVGVAAFWAALQPMRRTVVTAGRQHRVTATFRYPLLCSRV